MRVRVSVKESECILSYLTQTLTDFDELKLKLNRVFVEILWTILCNQKTGLNRFLSVFISFLIFFNHEKTGLRLLKTGPKMDCGPVFCSSV